MSETTVEPTVDAEPVTAEPAVDYAAELKAAKAAEEKWKAHSRKNEDAAKANAAAAKRLAEIEDAAKPAEERAAKALADAQAETASLKAEALRYRVAAKHKVSEDIDLDLLGSGSEEVLESRAARISALRSAEAELVAVKAELKALQSGKPAGRPVENLKPGATPSAIVNEDDSYPASWLPAARQAR